MGCIDVSLLIHSVVAISLIAAGVLLISIFGMVQGTRVGLVFGFVCMILGLFTFSLAAADSDVKEITRKDRRLMLSLTSAAAVAIGFILNYYNVQFELFGQNEIASSFRKALPWIEKILVFGGYAGLILAISMHGTRLSARKLVIAAAGAGVLAYSYYGLDYRTSTDMQKLIPMLGVVLVVAGISYRC